MIRQPGTTVRRLASIAYSKRDQLDVGSSTVSLGSGQRVFSPGFCQAPCRPERLAQVNGALIRVFPRYDSYPQAREPPRGATSMQWPLSTSAADLRRPLPKLQKQRGKSNISKLPCFLDRRCYVLLPPSAIRAASRKPRGERAAQIHSNNELSRARSTTSIFSSKIATTNSTPNSTSIPLTGETSSPESNRMPCRNSKSDFKNPIQRR